MDITIDMVIIASAMPPLLGKILSKLTPAAMSEGAPERSFDLSTEDQCFDTTKRWAESGHERQGSDGEKAQCEGAQRQNFTLPNAVPRMRAAGAPKVRCRLRKTASDYRQWV
jgi:hypothetical protein